MAVQEWTTTGFETTPAGSDSPAAGDDRIRELKETAGSLLDKEHIARDAGSTAAQGWHREGSAIAYYEASAPTNRPDAATSLDSNDAGRLWVDSDDGAIYFYTGAAWDKATPGTSIMDAIGGLTTAEIEQLQNIGSAAISAAEWGYMATMNQAVATTSNVTFNNVTHDAIIANTFVDFSSPTRGDVYDALAADLDDGATMVVSGALSYSSVAHIITHATRSGTTITLYGMNTATEAYTALACDSGDAVTTFASAILAW